MPSGQPAANPVDTTAGQKPARLAICGGGVIGAACAYFLSLRGVETVVVERAGVANAASGKSGGFLALDWCRGTPVDALARRSKRCAPEEPDGQEDASSCAVGEPMVVD